MTDIPAHETTSDIKKLSGFNDGQEIVCEGVKYIIKGDFDSEGKLIGWHKELVTPDEEI
ncbi:MAG: hypothetical protein KGZ81_07395 [Flavobacteriales bacterium]|nr:hypothetical protein [Flavobacteriales bacterium]